MADVYTPHHILHDILIRLPLKSLLRSRCVSTHWNSLISDPYFMKRRKILIPEPPKLYVLDDKANSIVELPSHFERRNITMVGTFHGIVLLFLELSYDEEMMVLYNPFTGAFKKLPNPPSLRFDSTRIFGFGYGATPDDLKIVIGCKPSYHYRYNCDVLSLNKGSWTTLQNIFQDVIFKDDHVGVFLNGFLHWVSCNVHMTIVALDLKKLVVSMMHVPDQCNYLTFVLGTLHGRLCMIDQSPKNGFDVWVMEKQAAEKSWSKMHSFTLGLEDHDLGQLETICILEDGKIVMRASTGYSPPLIIFDPSNGSYRKLEVPEYSFFKRGIEYVESLVSPANYSNMYLI